MGKVKNILTESEKTGEKLNKENEAENLEFDKKYNYEDVQKLFREKKQIKKQFVMLHTTMLLMYIGVYYQSNNSGLLQKYFYISFN